jgi:hypothetical protein
MVGKRLTLAELTGKDASANLPILPAPTPENAITTTMQFQQQVIIALNRIANSLETISTRLERIANKSN